MYVHPVYSQGTGERGGPGSVTVMTDRPGDSMGWSGMWSASAQREPVASFQRSHPLRWKFLRFPNVTQCAVQLTTHICWLHNTHTETE